MSDMFMPYEAYELSARLARHFGAREAYARLSLAAQALCAVPCASALCSGIRGARCKACSRQARAERAMRFLESAV